MSSLLGATPAAFLPVAGGLAKALDCHFSEKFANSKNLVCMVSGEAAFMVFARLIERMLQCWAKCT